MIAAISIRPSGPLFRIRRSSGNFTGPRPLSAGVHDLAGTEKGFGGALAARRAGEDRGKDDKEQCGQSACPAEMTVLV
jgi:hypothetical protein